MLFLSCFRLSAGLAQKTQPEEISPHLALTWSGRSPPVAVDVVPTAVALVVARGHPDGVRVRRPHPGTADPAPLGAGPVPVARHPVVAWAWRGDRHLRPES